ncbi:hypothetical protein B0J14DRAFT_658948 [Halenospora varia]|nr:hypothetical protein B0J14DRAFT_658948 [Halenospora varia]
MATQLGELAEHIRSEYDGDLNTMLKKTVSKKESIREELKKIKGFGGLGVDIFFDSAQGLWICLAPFPGVRNVETAKKIGLSGDVDEIWEYFGKGPEKMC